MFDYLLWRGDLTFEHSPFNPVDNIIFSQLSYLPLDGIVPGLDDDREITVARAAAIFAERMATNTLQSPVIFKDDPAFLETLGRTSRFKNCLLHSYVNHVDTVLEKQFSALCVNSGASTFITYRGTDANVVGWKEDFNMSFSSVVPAQLEAVSYLEKIAIKTNGLLLICGHSKGGNLAIYAASSCTKKTRRRIARIYSNDAPGFHRQFIQSDGFRKVRRRIHSFVPQSSVVGLLFEQGNDYTVIKSSQIGIFQHDLYSWEITHNDMIRLDHVDRGSRFIDKTLSEWINGLDSEHRRQFSDTLFGVLRKAQIKSFSELGTDRMPATIRMIQSLGNIDRTTGKNIRKMLTALFKAAKNNINTLLPQKNKRNRHLQSPGTKKNPSRYSAAGGEKK